MNLVPFDFSRAEPDTPYPAVVHYKNTNTWALTEVKRNSERGMWEFIPSFGYSNPEEANVWSDAYQWTFQSTYKRMGFEPNDTTSIEMFEELSDIPITEEMYF